MVYLVVGSAMLVVVLCVLALAVQGVTTNSCRFFDVVDKEVVKDGLKGTNNFTSVFNMFNVVSLTILLRESLLMHL